MKRDEFLGLFLAQLEIKDLITDKKKKEKGKKRAESLMQRKKGSVLNVNF